MPEDFLLKDKLTDDEEIQLLKRIADEYSGTDKNYYKRHLDKIIIKYKENMEQYKKLQYENQSLKEQLKMVIPQWKITRNCAQGIDPITNEIKEYDIPLNFNESYVRKLHSIEDTPYFCYFVYYFDNDPSRTKEYTWPWSLYYFLSEKNKEITDKKIENKIVKITTMDEMKSHIETYNEFSDNYEFFDIATNFILSRKRKGFTTKEFRNYCEIHSSSTTTDLLNMLEKCNVIEKRNKGLWKIKIETNVR